MLSFPFCILTKEKSLRCLLFHYIPENLKKKNEKNGAYFLFMFLLSTFYYILKYQKIPFNSLVFTFFVL